MEITDFYNHNFFIRNVVEGNKIVNKSDLEISKMEKETTDLKIGDIIQSKNYYKSGKIINIYYEGRFLRFVIDYDFDTKKENHCVNYTSLKKR